MACGCFAVAKVCGCSVVAKTNAGPAVIEVFRTHPRTIRSSHWTILLMIREHSCQLSEAIAKSLGSAGEVFASSVEVEE